MGNVDRSALAYMLSKELQRTIGRALLLGFCISDAFIIRLRAMTFTSPKTILPQQPMASSQLQVRSSTILKDLLWLMALVGASELRGLFHHTLKSKWMTCR